MNMLFRVLLAIYAFCLAVISAVFMLVTFEHSILDSIYYYLSETVLGNTYATIVMLLISLVFFVLSIAFLLSGFKTGKDKKSVSKITNIGEIKISLDTLESISLAASKRLHGVTGTRAQVTKMEDDVSITIKMNVLPDVNIPSLSEQMQHEVKNSVEGSSGVNVKDVQIVVDDISEPEGYRAGTVGK